MVINLPVTLHTSLLLWQLCPICLNHAWSVIDQFIHLKLKLDCVF